MKFKMKILQNYLLTHLVFFAVPIFATERLELNLVCAGEFSVNGQNKFITERSYVIKDKNLYYAGNTIPCEITPSQIRCWKWNEQNSKWTIQLERVTGKVVYEFKNLKLSIIEEFNGVCKNVNKAF
jgi:hypothetical protein